MMKINWKVRLLSKKFWVSIVPATLLLIQVIAVPLGYKFDISIISKQLLDIVNAAFAVMTVLGVVIDPTTSGLSDSERALKYKKEDK